MNCPKCNSQMKIRSGVHGEFWGCTGYPECKETVSIHKEKEFKELKYNKVDSTEKIVFTRILVAEVSNFESEKDANEYMEEIKKVRKGVFKINHYSDFWQVEWHSE